MAINDSRQVAHRQVLTDGLVGPRRGQTARAIRAEPGRLRSPRIARLELIARKSDVLKPSTLACINHMPAINVTQGCGHRCVYCYARAYPTYAGDDRVLLYANLAEKIADELARRRTWPEQVFFSSSSDCFGPYAELQRVTYRTMRLFLERGIRVAFLTKGCISPPFFELFRRHADLIDAQIGLMTLSPEMAGMIEPFAATPEQRLENVECLQQIGVHVGVRIDPMIPGVTDTTVELLRLMQALARRDVGQVAASYLFLRVGIRRLLQRELRPARLRDRVLDAYRNGPRIIHRASPDGFGVIALPKARRREGFDRLRAVADRFGISVDVCGCKNTDLAIGGRCNITHARPSQRTEEQLTLFADEA